MEKVIGRFKGFLEIPVKPYRRLSAVAKVSTLKGVFGNFLTLGKFFFFWGGGARYL